MMMPRRCMVYLVFLAVTVSMAQSPTPAKASGYRIAGLLVDGITGLPLGDATVLLSPIAERQNQLSFRTAADGNFLFSGLPPGKYSLGAKRNGYRLQGFDEHEFFSTAIAVGPNIDSEHLLFRLHPDASIRGTITDEQNEPAPSINVRLYGISTENGETSIRRINQVSTDDRGQYSFSHLREGTYYIAASGRPWYSGYMGFFQQSRQQNTDPESKARIEQEAAKLDLVYPLTFYSGTLSSDDATPIHLNAGDNSTADLALQPVRSIHIRIPWPADAVENQNQAAGKVGPAAGILRPRMAMPSIRLSQELFNGKIEDDSMSTVVFGGGPNSGFNEFEGIAPGRYIVQIVRQGASDSTATTQELDLTSDMVLPSSSGAPLASVSGNIWLNGVPMDKAFVGLQGADGVRSFGGQVKKGEFKFDEPVPPGRYQITIASQVSNSNNVYLSAFTATGAKISGRSIQITSGASVHLAILASEGIAQIDGVAKLSDKPKAGVMILLVPENLANSSGLARRDQSDSDGTFTLRQVVPGKYKLLAIENGWKLAWADPKVLKPFLTNAREYTIQPNQKLQVMVEVQSVK